MRSDPGRTTDVRLDVDGLKVNGVQRGVPAHIGLHPGAFGLCEGRVKRSAASSLVPPHCWRLTRTVTDGESLRIQSNNGIW